MAEVAPERREPLPSDNSRSDLVASAAGSAAASAPDQHPNTTTTMAEGNGDVQVDATQQLQSQSHLPPSSSSTSTAPPARPPSPPSNPSPRPDTHREASMASSSHKMAISDDDEERERARGAVAGSSTDPRRNDRDDTDADETVQPPRSRVRMRSERANVLDEAAKRRHRRRPSTDSAASSAGRSRTPSPILGRASTTALVTRSDIQAILYNSSGQSAYGGVEAAKPQTFADSSEINAVIASVEGMDLRDQGSDLAAMVRKLGQHALEQDTYIRSMEESMHNTRVTAVSVISNLTASHAYELAQERQLRDRLEVELEGAQASARMLSSLLNKSQSKSREMDRQRAASVEEEMKWAASLPGAGLRKPSATAVAGANAASEAISPRPPPPPTTPPKSMGLGITDTTTTPSSSSHHPQDVFDSPMSAVIAERNKLAADKRYLRNRVRDAEAQLHRLENELKALRPLLVQGTGGSGGSGAKAMLSAPSTPHRSRDQVVPMTGGSSATTPGNRSSKKAASGSSRRRRPTTLGDAEAEHLLLAARRLNSVRAQQQQQEAGTDAGSPVARPRTPPPRLGPGIPPKTPSSTATLTARTPRTIKHAVGGGSPVKLTSRNGKASLDAMPPSPAPVYDAAALMGSPQAKARALARERGDGSTFEPRHERVDSTASHISHTSQASHAGMDELLHAAQSVLTPRDRAAAAQQQAAAPNNYFPPAAALPKTHDVAQRPPSYFESPKRRRVSMSAGDADWAAQQRIMSASPQQRYANPLHHKSSFPLLSSSPRRARTRTEGAERDRAGGASDADEPPLSALDLLADQAAASQNPSQSSEPSSSDNERRDDDQRRHAGGFSSQEENGDDDGGPPRGISGLPPPRSAASSLMAARSRVNAGPSSGAPIAYAHSVAPHSDYGSPRYAQGGPPPPLPPSGHGHGMIGSPVSHGSSPLLNNEGYALPPIHTGLPPPPPPPPHGMHSAAGGHYGSGLPPPPPPPPGMPLHPHHHHHHMPYAHHGPYSPHGGMNGMGSPNIPLPPTPSAYLSPNSADANGFAPLPGGAHGHRSSASYDGGPTGGPPKPSTSSSTSSTASASAAAASSKPKGGNTSPDKRLPYVRWTSEEDEKLKRAIAQYGQRWEAVAKAVGTRSYHQCRQRALLMRRKGVDPAAAGRAGGGGSGGGTGQRGSGSASAASASGSPVGEEGEGEEDGGAV